tara:strand:- start:252 stop:872 length:621 start_codon:yes stop_codon:yes gene_type:complete
MLDMEQGTPEWLQARCGLITASKINAVMSKGRGSAPSATRATYMAELVAERLTGNPTAGFTNSSMDWGTETEPQARAEYTMRTGNMVEEVAFVPHPSLQKAGASPDGLVSKEGLVEIKCPNTSTHIATLLGGPIKSGYRLQMQWQMACTGRKWCDFVSFDPRMPDDMAYHCTRVERDNDEISAITSAVSAFDAELETLIENLKEAA